MNLKISLLLSVGLFSTTMHAGIIYSNFGPSNAYDGSNSWGVYGSGNFLGVGYSETAARFTPSDNVTLTQIDIALWAAVPDSIVLTLNSDSGGLPGGTLATWNLSGLPGSGSCCIVQTVTPASPITLNSGTQYWIVAAPGDPEFLGAWNANSLGIQDPFAQDTGGGFSPSLEQNTPAFDVLGDVVRGSEGTDVPEPATLTLLSTSLLFALVLGHKGRITSL